MRFVFLPNKIKPKTVDGVLLVRLSSVIELELTEKFQFDYRTNRTTIRQTGFD